MCNLRSVTKGQAAIVDFTRITEPSVDVEGIHLNAKVAMDGRI